MAFFSTPARRPVKRRLFFTPMSVKRFRPNPTRRIRQLNRRTVRGPSRRGSLRQQVSSLQKVVSNLQPEIKFADTSIAANNIPTTGFVHHVTQVSAGDGESNRTGTAISVKTIAIRGIIGTAADLSVTQGVLRFLIVVDREQIADTSPTAAGIIADGVFTANPVMNLPNTEELERFRILYSSRPIELRRLSLDTDQFVPGTASSIFEYNWSGTLKVSYNGTAVSDIAKNGIYFVILSDQAAATVDFTGVARLGFTDV